MEFPVDAAEGPMHGSTLSAAGDIRKREKDSWTEAQGRTANGGTKKSKGGACGRKKWKRKASLIKRLREVGKAIKNNQAI